LWRRANPALPGSTHPRPRCSRGVDRGPQSGRVCRSVAPGGRQPPIELGCWHRGARGAPSSTAISTGELWFAAKLKKGTWGRRLFARGLRCPHQPTAIHIVPKSKLLGPSGSAFGQDGSSGLDSRCSCCSFCFGLGGSNVQHTIRHAAGYAGTTRRRAKRAGLPQRPAERRLSLPSSTGTQSASRIALCAKVGRHLRELFGSPGGGRGTRKEGATWLWFPSRPRRRRCWM
jgi:hypothetical protein